MPEEIRVTQWLDHGNELKEGDTWKRYRIGHSKHGGQIIIYGSEDLMRQVVKLLNSNDMEFTYDEEKT